jgi:hypothetical protein
MHLRGVDDFTAERLNHLAGGVAVSDDVLGIVKRIQEYDENLVVQFVDPDQADFADAPYRVMERCPDQQLRLVMSVWKLDGTVLERIQSLDTQRFDTLAVLDRNNNAVRLGEQRRFREERAALSEMVVDVLRSPKDTYTAVNPVTGQEHKFTNLRQG